MEYQLGTIWVLLEQFAQENNALLFGLEHRYYGDIWPVAVRSIPSSSL
jgi:hypothetical protein